MKKLGRGMPPIWSGSLMTTSRQPDGGFSTSSLVAERLTDQDGRVRFA